MAKVGRASRTALISTSLPPAERRRARQPDKYLSTFAIKGVNAASRSFSADSGNPR
jgi:hypothetical protein